MEGKVELEATEYDRLLGIEARYKELQAFLDDPVKVALRQLHLACRARKRRNTTDKADSKLDIAG